MATNKKEGRAFIDKLAPGEPFFILRGADRLAPKAIDEWVRAARANKVNHAKQMEAMECAEDMRKWPNRKVPD